MKYKLLRRFSLLLLFMVGGVLAGQAGVVTKWVKTAPAQLATNDVVVIVDETTSKAMANNKGTSAPTATSVTLNNDKSAITSEVDATLQWTVTKDNDKYMFGIGEKDSLYCTNTNNGVKVGSSANNVFTIENGYLKNSGTSRYLGVYNSQDWRCYTNTTGNISGTVTSFYKKTEVEESRTDITVTFPQESYSAVLGNAFSAPTASVSPAAYDGAITYNSTNEQVATVNPTTGAVTLVGVGTTTINALASETNNYQGGSASYTLTCMGAIEDGIFDFSLYNDYGSGFEFTKVGIHEGTWTAGNVSMYVEGRNGWYNSDYTLKLYAEVAADPDKNLEAQPAGKITLSVPQGYLISKVEFTGTVANMTANGGTYESGTWTGALNSIAFTAIGDVSFKLITVTYRSESQKETTVTLTGDYSVMGAVGENLTLPTAVVKAEGQPIDATVNWSSDDPTIAAIENGTLALKAKGNVTLTATFDGDNNNATSNASYSVKVGEAAYTTIPDMLAAITSTKTPVVYRFNNVLVTYANYSNFYISDGTNSFLLYGSNLGLTAGDKVTGELYGNLYTYKNLPEIAVNKDDIVFTQNSTGNAVEPATITIDQLSENVNKYIKIEHATFVSIDNKNIAFKVGETDLSAYNQWNIATTDLTADQNYTITAMGSVKDEVYQIYPISFELEAAPEPAGFRDIKIDFTQHAELATGSNVYITVAADGTIGTTDDVTKAAATIKANAHGSYGTSNFTASVPVEGCVKITYATHDFGNDITVTNANGDEVAKLNTMGEKWMSNHDNVVVAYYRTNEPTTLNFSNANYNPYFAVEAIDEADLPAEITNYNVTFAAGDGTGVAPAALEVAAGSKFLAPKNYTLYKEGATLTGWSDGTTTYTPGTEISPAADMTLTAVFTNNEVSLADRTAAVTLNYVLNGYYDNPKYKYEGNKGILVTQATIGDKTIDVKVDVDATGGKFAHNGSGWHQVNTGTKVTVPSCKGAAIAVATYNDATSVTFGGEAGTADGNTANYEATGDAEAIVIEQVANNYWNNLSIILPVVTDEPVSQDITGTWSYADKGIMNATMAFSKSNEAGEVEAMEKNGLKMIIEANGAEFRDNGDNIQVPTGAVFKVPVKNAGDLVTVKGYPGYSYYTIAGSNELKDENTYKAKLSDVEKGYVAITSTNGNNYYKSISVTQYAPKEKITLDNEAVTATFPFNQGTDGQKATFSGDYFLSSKVGVGSGLSIKGIDNKGLGQTCFDVANKDSKADEVNAIRFLITPKPGFVFTPTKASFKTTRFGTNGGKLDIAWQNTNGTTVSLASGVQPIRDNENPNVSNLSYDITGATPGEGACGLLINLYSLDPGKQVGFADIVIEGTLSGEEKDVPVLTSFKINGTSYAVEDVFGELYEATLKLSKKDAMVSESNPLTEIQAGNGEIGNVTYQGSETACTVTIPMTAGDTQMDYVLSIVQKPDYTLSYMDVDGTTVLKTQIVEEDGTIGEFAYNFAEVKATKDGYKARGWFKQGVLGEKFTTADIITANAKLYAIQTEIEVASTHKKYYFDLADKNFYAEDHEAFVPAGEGYYWHDAQHGWAFKNGNTVDLLVGPKATITVILCQYGSGTGIVVKKGSETLATLDGIAAGDGGTAVYNYEGEAGTLTLEMQCGGEMYIHGIKIVNTAEVNFDSKDNWYFVKAGDAGSLIDVIDVVNGINANKDAARSFIFLPDGTYDLDATVKTAITGHNISIIGQSMDKTIIVTKPDKSIEGLGKADMFDNSGSNLYMQDLTLQNALDYYKAGSAGRAAVLQDAGTRTIGKNVRMLSYQDTYYSSNSSQQAYWENCDIHGTVDFICGGGDIRFQNTTITLEKRALDGKGGRTITAPTTNTQFGYVFDGCTVVDLSGGKGDWNFGRTWQNEPICVYLNTTLDEIAAKTLVDSRWTQKGMNNKDPKLFGEYGTKDANGTDITPAFNKITSFGGIFETVLTAEKAAEFAYEKMFTDWDPKSLASQVAAPSATYENGAVTFAIANNGMIGAAIFKNDVFAGISLNGTFNITADSENDVLTIRGINQMGGFGPAATVSTATGIGTVKTDSDANAIYTLQGVRVEKATRGLYIKGGKTIFVK